MRRFLDLFVWLIVIGAIVGTVYATADTPPEGKRIHGRWVVGGEHNAKHCRICINGEVP